MECPQSPSMNLRIPPPVPIFINLVNIGVVRSGDHKETLWVLQIPEKVTALLHRNRAVLITVNHELVKALPREVPEGVKAIFRKQRKESERPRVASQEDPFAGEGRLQDQAPGRSPA